MKKWLSGLMALAMLLTVCVGCGKTNNNTGAGQEDTSLPSIPDGVYYDITGIHANETMMTINGRQIPSEQYFYWLAYTCSNLEYTILTYYNYYGYYAELVNEETGTLRWDYEGDFYNGMTMPQYAIYETENSLRFYTTLEECAQTYGAQPDEEDLAAMEASHQQALEELGGQEGFDEYLVMLGISADYFDQLSRSGYIYDNLLEQVLTEGSQLYLEDAGYDGYATYADHILLATIDLATGAALAEEEVQAQYALAEDLLEQLSAASDADRPALFAQLADEYSQDTGRATNPEGYVYTPGTMVSEFEDAASALQPGQVSGIVETTYGYHIIMRKELAQGLAANPQQKEELAGEYLSTFLTELGQKAQVERSAVLDSLDVEAFYNQYNDFLVELNEADQAEAETETETETQTEEK